MNTIARGLSTTALALTLAVTGVVPSMAEQLQARPGTTSTVPGPDGATTHGSLADPSPDFWCLIFRCRP